ncbi:hypothetical protein, partial [Sinorhizobium meliloti]|uniref:hypothetical protein n=1 Tax=Rhizobium meliloti TaxID=382 RepID=UPI001AECB94B
MGLEEIERVALGRGPPGLGGCPAAAKIECSAPALQHVEHARRIGGNRQHGARLRRIDRDAGGAGVDYDANELADGLAERALGTGGQPRAGLALQVDAAGVFLFEADVVEPIAGFELDRDRQSGVGETETPTDRHPRQQMGGKPSADLGLEVHPGFGC